MSQMSHASSEQISEGANGDIGSFLNQSDLPFGLDFDIFLDRLLPSSISIDGVCDYQDFTESVPDCTQPNEFDRYFRSLSSSNQSLECDNNRALMNNPRVQIGGNDKRSQPLISPVELSQSVGVGLPQKTFKASDKVQIVHELEEFFRPRYKSDYFAQNGKSRKPRYVADRKGNHYITLKIPIGLRGQIRVDWLTVADASGDRYSMPYRFQQSNELADVPDCNPFYINIETDKSGLMKLYLVLIKSKQDELKTLQPLIPFRPFHDVLGLSRKHQIESSYILNPKQLIQNYQLDQSQLAFTFCTFRSDRKSSVPEWNTTVFSTVLTEAAPENVRQRPIACPRCTHIFHIAANGEQDGIQVMPVNKRKADGCTNDKTIKKQNSL